LSQVTERIGLVATGSTTFDAPYHIARRFASLDHLSGGRAGWNIVTTSNPDAALNFGMEEHMEHSERYARAREFYDVVTGLWDSWADDAFVRDVEKGFYFDPDKLHVFNHKGKYLSVRGPLNIARPIQGWPVIVQAGASEAGRQLAAETADVHCEIEPRSGARVLCRCEKPGGKSRAVAGPSENPSRMLRRGR
jgi:alkanesulfonate monooxygenase